MIDGLVPGSKEQLERREPSGWGPKWSWAWGWITNSLLPLGCRKEKQVPMASLSAALEVNRPRRDIHPQVSSTPVLTPSNTLSTVTPHSVGGMRVSRERGRQTEIKRLPAILAAILNPSPNSP